MKELVIKSDEQRGVEVITLLELLGGKNVYKYGGDCSDKYYHLNSDYMITVTESPYNSDKFKAYTLDEFWTEFPYKDGDKVINSKLNTKAEVIRMLWNEYNECVMYMCKDISNGEKYCLFAEEMIPIETNTKDVSINIAEILKDAQKGTKLYSPIVGDVYINDVNKKYVNVMAQDGTNWGFTFEGKLSTCSINENAECLLFPSKENRDWSTFKVEPGFPTTYKKCNLFLNRNEIKESNNKIETLKCLIVCRNVWWKVDNDWKPNWSNNNEEKSTIALISNKICACESYKSHHILAFRTSTIRNKFLETFKDLIEECKEFI